MLIDEVIKWLEETDNDEKDLKNLGEAVEYYCGVNNKVAGLKYALLCEVRDLQSAGDYDDEAQVQLLKMFAIVRGIKINKE